MERTVLWNMYAENTNQARHHETQRSTVAAALIAISGALLGLVTFDDRVTFWDAPLTVFITAIGVFGALFSLKQYERFNLHMERARAYRDALDELLPDMPLKRLKLAADARHKHDFPRLEPARLNWFWTGLYLLICALGAGLTGTAVLAPSPPEAAAAPVAAAQPPAAAAGAAARAR